MIDRMSYLYGSENLFIIHEEKESTIHSILIRGDILCDDTEKCFIVLSDKESIRDISIGILLEIPLLDHFDVSGFMRDVRESQIIHNLY